MSVIGERQKACRYCKMQIPYRARVCPYCGKRQGLGVAQQIVLAFLIFFIVFILIITVAGLSDDKTDSTVEISSKRTEENAQENVEENTEELSVKKGVVYKGHNTTVRTTGEVKDGISKCKVSLRYKNDSDENLNYCIHSYAVNGIMAEDSMYVSSTDVAAGKKASNTLDIDKSWLQECGIDKIEYIDILFWAYSDYLKSFESEVVRIKTNFYGGQLKQKAGKKVYSNDDLSVRLISLSDSKCKFAVINNSNQYFDFDIDNVSVNDWTYDTGIDVFDEEILPGCMGIYEFKISSDFKDDNSIKNVKRVEFACKVRPLGKYLSKNSYTTGVIKVEKSAEK